MRIKGHIYFEGYTESHIQAMKKLFTSLPDTWYYPDEENVWDVRIPLEYLEIFEALTNANCINFIKG